MSQDSADLTNATILIVDDIPANLNILCQALEREGYSIIAAPSGEVALRIVAQTQPDLILLDIMMPELDGFETCRRLKADELTVAIPVIFITAQDETKSMIEGFGVGAVDYITKPFQHEEVRVRVQTHLTIKRLRDGLEEAKGELESAYRQLETDNARKTEELETARVIQNGFLPVSVPDLPFLDIASFQKSATEVGGDYYDFFLEPPSVSPQNPAPNPSPTRRGEEEEGDIEGGCAHSSKLLVAIGDATGHGVGASLMVSATKMALRTVDEPELARKISQINSHLKQINSSHRLNMSLTLVELGYDEKSSSMQVKATGGGMPPLIILRADGEVEARMIEGLPLGAIKTARYGLTEFRLEPLDLLILMSDGLPERINDVGEQLGDTQIVSKIRSAGKMGTGAAELVEVLVQFGNDWSNHTPQNDDVTLVVLKVK